MTRAPLVLTAAIALAVTAGTGAPPALQAPRWTRGQMESALGPGARWTFVYGTLDPAAAPALRARALQVARRLFGGDTTRVVADREVAEATLAEANLVLIGGPRENAVSGRAAPALPVRFADGAFGFAGRTYARPGDAIHLVYPNPWAPRRFLLLVAGNSPDAAARGGPLFGDEDWRIVRDGELARSGAFAQSAQAPWRYDPALDHDREALRERFAASLRAAGTGALRVRAAPDLEGAGELLAAGRTLLAELDRAGFAAPRGAAPVTATLYRSIEEKGLLARDTRPEHVDGRGDAHLAKAAGRAGFDLWSVAAARLVRLGAAPDAPLLEPAGAWLAGRTGGEPLAAAVARLYAGRLLPTADAALARDGWRCPLVAVPARALLLGALLGSAGSRGRAALLAALVPDPSGSLDSLCARARVDPRAVERRYALLADSLARAGRAPALAGGPRPWRPADGFMRGVCLAHSMGLERGYASAACARELERLRDMGAAWVSLSPFAYLPSTRDPVLHPSAGADEESDEAVCEAAARARALGLRVMLAPQLWTRGWVGDLDFGPAGWPAFFERYRTFLLHHALLAEREGMDALVVGHELASASLGHPEAWRALIGDVRRVYRGIVVYDANWGDEVRGVQFWDACDLVGVSFYDPLAARPTTDPRALREGAARALAGLREVGRRARRPVVLLEAGYAPHPDAMVRPWDEGAAGPPDLDAQRACYQALVEALDPEDWVAGVFWWKWFSGGEGGPTDHSFSPCGKPAERVMERALSDWRDRPVRVPEPRGR